MVFIIDVCDPPCVYGACVSNATCFCSNGYEGQSCDTPGKTFFYILKKYSL